ncbi:hypothetical protein ACS0TY_014989 [Phlomoides rotata]
MATQTTPMVSVRSGRPIATVAHIPPRCLSLNSLRKPSKSIISASLSSNLKISATKTPNSDRDVLSGSTRTVTTLFAVAITASKLITHGIFNLAVQLKEPAISAAGPAFFAAVREAPTGLNTPLTVVAAGMAKWLDIYSGVLMVRVLLSWFPNIPWDRQPLSAIRDLCDPYLNLFRNLVPPIFNALDVSPLLAFAVLGTLGSILHSSRTSL